ncbi:hypothetical protein [Nocardioides sediminis]|uniref:hypothetical protein n=1 Tax=Nocardioides sediminis TaxID=433648 RepID=UPI000D2F85D3|nr:hypothetical protein [Nocardioides sediminis]
MSSQSRVAPTRRTVLRAAAWTAPAVSIAVAAPAYAASTCDTITGTRNGSNYYAKITCSGTIRSVQIGSAVAVLTGGQWHAQLSGVGNTDASQVVTVKMTAATIQQAVVFTKA